MTKTNRDNKKIAKNTFFLYLRMLFLIPLGVFTSRIVLEALGETDYGIFNVVGGVVVLLNFLNSTLVASTQRYINLALGEKSENYTHSVFSAAIKIHFFLSIVIIVLAELIGVYIVNTVLSIPKDRLLAANIIYQFSIATIVFTINTSPLQAMVISQEKMDSYAILSILEMVLKFTFVYLLLVTSKDKLIIYGGTICLISLLILIAYWMVCKTKFPVCRQKLCVTDKSIYKSMLGFSSWALIGSLAGSLSNQGINILLNAYFGPVVNAARGLAMTFNNYIFSFVNNFTVAVNPQLVKTYASKEYNTMYNLLLTSIKFSLFLYAFFAIPIIFECHFILDLWLKDIPKHTVIFCQIVLIESFVSCAERPMATVCNAIGCVKQINLSIGILYVISFFLAWILISKFPNVVIPFYVHLITIAIGVVAFLYYIGKYVKINKKQFTHKVILRTLYAFTPTIIILSIIQRNLQEGWLRFFIIGISSTILLISSMYWIGFNNDERLKFISFIKKTCGKYGKTIKNI